MLANIVAKYTIKYEQGPVGHVASAVAEDGTVIASATGFGRSDAKRQLKAALNPSTQTQAKAVPKRTSQKKRKKPGKVHNPSGIIFAAKRNIEQRKAKRAGIKGKATK